MNTMDSSANPQISLALLRNFDNNLVSDSKKTATVKDLASELGVSPDTIKNCIRRIMPGKMQNGKKTVLTGREIACISKELKGNIAAMSHQTYEVSSQVKNSTTELEVIGNAITAFNALQNLYNQKEAEYKAVIESQKHEITELSTYKFDTEKKLANGELVETPSENARNHLWQNMQKVGSAMNDFKGAWRKLYELVKRDMSIDIKIRASNQNMKCMDYICNELSIENFNRVFALSEKLKKEYCGE